MIKKTVYLFVIASFVLITSCEKKAENITKLPEMVPVATNLDPKETRDSAKRLVPADGKYPIMAFDKTEHDFGMITTGDKVEYSFSFRNTGEADLIITRAVGSCGCTVPEYPKEAIKPGESAKMKVSFNSAGKHGQQQKSVTIITNTEKGTESLLIKASIKEKK